MTSHPHSQPGTAQRQPLTSALRNVLSVMRAARLCENKQMNVWADDVRAVADVVEWLEKLEPTP